MQLDLSSCHNLKEEDLIVIIRHCNNNFNFEGLICNVFNLFLN